MQFAERWIGVTSIAVALGAGVGLLARPHHHEHHARAFHFDTGRTHCRGVPAVQPQQRSVDEILIAGAEDTSFDRVIKSADVSHCFEHSTSLDMLIDIGADGRVRHVSHRPQPPTNESRCIGKAVRGLQFAPSDTAISVRYVFNRS